MKLYSATTFLIVFGAMLRPAEGRRPPDVGMIPEAKTRRLAPR
jgi:hypothetical protein